MGIRTRKGAALMVASIFTLLNVSSPALAGSADSAVKACKVAIADDQGSGMMARLKKIKTRGNSYETWFNLSDGDAQMKAYCVIKRDKVEEIFTSEGRWSGRNPGRPESIQTS